MKLVIRLYKRFDTDLLSLAEAGYDMGACIVKALYAYAHDEDFHILVPECRSHDLNGEQFIRTRLSISDRRSADLLKQIKHGYRNAFCKALVRDALVRQAFGVFFSNPAYIRREQARIDRVDSAPIPGLSAWPGKKKQRVRKEDIIKPAGYSGKKADRESSGHQASAVAEKPGYDETGKEKRVKAEQEEAPAAPAAQQKASDQGENDEALLDVFKSMITN